MSHSIANLWEPFGLRSTPFFQEELRPGDVEHPVELFVGRDEELRRLVRRVVSDGSSRTIVQGEPGVGKTSFINRLKSELSRQRIATYEHPIRIRSGTRAETLVADVLRLLLRIRLAMGRGAAGDFWGRTARMLEGGEIRGGSASAMGVGAGVSRGWVPAQVAADSLYEHLGEALRRLSEEGSAGVLVHVNNLENLTEEDADEAAALLRDLRDHLLLPGAHWIFGGAAGVDTVFRRFAQVDGIFPAAETLEPLPAERMAELLSRRYAHLSTGTGTVPPVEPEVAGRLYSLYRGDLRNFLRLLGDAAERGLGLKGVRPMTLEEVVRYTASDYERRLLDRLGPGDHAHLRAIVTGTEPPYEFRVKEAARAAGIKQSSASQLVDRLIRNRAIRRVRTEGKSVYYGPAGDVLVALGRAPI